MYCITTVFSNDFPYYILYLAYQNIPDCFDDGYFWTTKETFKKVLTYNTKDHPFLFETEEEAMKLIDKLELKKTWKNCKVIKWEP